MISRIFFRPPKARMLTTFQKRTFIRTYRKESTTEPCYFTEVAFLNSSFQLTVENEKFHQDRTSSSDEEERDLTSFNFEDQALEEETVQHYKPPVRNRRPKVPNFV